MARVTIRRGRPIRRRRRHEQGRRVRNLMPVKPRKPASAFNLFVKDYFRSAMARNFRTAPEAMAYAGQFWRNHPNQRQQYESMARPERTRFNATFLEYKKKKHLLKRPGNAFICFVKDYYRREGRDRPVWEVGRQAGVIWKRMSVAERQPFQQQADRAKATHDRMLEDLNAGRTRFTDYFRPPGEAQAGNAAANQA